MRNIKTTVSAELNNTHYLSITSPFTLVKYENKVIPEMWIYWKVCQSATIQFSQYLVKAQLCAAGPAEVL